jgi:hypothetical protein
MAGMRGPECAAQARRPRGRDNYPIDRRVGDATVAVNPHILEITGLDLVEPGVVAARDWPLVELGSNKQLNCCVGVAQKSRRG